MNQGHFNNLGFNGGQPADMQNLYFSNNPNACFNFYIGSVSHRAGSALVSQPQPPPQYPTGFQPTYHGQGQQNAIVEMNRNNAWMASGNTLSVPSSHYQMFSNSNAGGYNNNNHGYPSRGAAPTNFSISVDTSRLNQQADPIVLVVQPAPMETHTSGCFFNQPQPQRQNQNQQQASFYTFGSNTAQAGSSNPPMMSHGSSAGENTFLIRPTSASTVSESSFCSGSSLPSPSFNNAFCDGANGTNTTGFTGSFVEELDEPLSQHLSQSK